ncbi:PilN domain-containing protein [Natronospora cellulosivora (SeqCode)]
MGLQTYLMLDDDILQLLQLKKGKVIFNQVYNYNPQENKISEYLKKLKKKAKKIKIIIPATKILTKNMELPSVNDKKIYDILQYKFLNELPYEQNEIYFRYLKNNKSSNKQGLALAVSKDYIKEISSTCSEEGIEVTEILPLVPLFYLTDNMKLTNADNNIYIHIAKNYCYFVLLYNGNRYVKGIRYYEKEDIYEELLQILEYAKEEIGIEDLNIIINKKVLKIEDIKKYILELDKNDIQEDFIWKEFSSIEKKLKALDFYQLLPQVKRKHNRKQFASIAVLLLLVLLVNGTNFYYRWQDKTAYIDSLAEIESQQEIILEGVKELEIEHQILEDHLEIYRTIGDNNNHSYLPWLIELSKLLPEETIIYNINFRERELTLLSGKANSASDVLAAIESSSLFSRVNFIGSVNIEEGMETFRIAGDLLHEYDK